MATVVLLPDVCLSFNFLPAFAAVCCRSDCVAAGRAAPEGLRSGLWYLSLHCNQHLRDNRLEGLQPHHCQHWQRYECWEQTEFILARSFIHLKCELKDALLFGFFFFFYSRH